MKVGGSITKQEKLEINLRDIKDEEAVVQKIFEGLMEWKIEKEEILDSQVSQQVEWDPEVLILLGNINLKTLKALSSELKQDVDELFSNSHAPVPDFELKFILQSVEIKVEIVGDTIDTIRKGLQNLEKIEGEIFPTNKQLRIIWDSDNKWEVNTD